MSHVCMRKYNFSQHWYVTPQWGAPIAPGAEGLISLAPLHFPLSSSQPHSSRLQPTTPDNILKSALVYFRGHERCLIWTAKSPPIYARHAVYLIHDRPLATPKRRPGSSLQTPSACLHPAQLIRYRAHAAAESYYCFRPSAWRIFLLHLDSKPFLTPTKRLHCTLSMCEALS